MWRYLGGAASALCLVGAGFFIAKTMADTDTAPSKTAGSAPAAAKQKADNEETDMLASPMAFANAKPQVPRADELSKEEKRFNRYDQDNNGAVNREEYMFSRRKAYAKLDKNGDGRLSFDEYAYKAVEKFARADNDRSGVLNRGEFSTTRTVRKDKPKPKCARTVRNQAPSETSSEAEDG
jgi:Ca2+-binding EF-hand superfamily protein